MPVLLTYEDEFETWLTGPADEAFALAREYAPDQMRIVQEGLDKEDLLGKPVPVGAEAGLTRANDGDALAASGRH
jgi:hypothetical protein